MQFDRLRRTYQNLTDEPHRNAPVSHYQSDKRAEVSLLMRKRHFERRKDDKMRLHENEMSMIDRNWRHIRTAEILEVNGNTITTKTILPNLRERTDIFPLADATGLKSGMFIDWSEVGASAVKIWGVTPQDAVEKYQKDIEKWRRGAAG